MDKNKNYNKIYRKLNREKIAKYKYSKNNHCTCGNLIDNRSKNCNICENKRRHKLGILNSYLSNYIDGRTNKIYYCIDCKINKISYVTWRDGNKRCASCSNKGERHHYYNKKLPYMSKLMKTLWNDVTFRTKRLKASMLGRNFKPNNSEKLLIKLFKTLNLPYKFVGDGKVILAGFCPDFINKKNKKIIEFNGTYWHRNTQEKDQRKLKEYKKLGYKTLVIWDTELKDIDKVTKKLIRFA